MGSNTSYVKVLWLKKTTTASFRYFNDNLSFWYQEGRKYGIELLKEEGYKGSKLIIRGTNNSDTGGFFQKHFVWNPSSFLQAIIFAQRLPVSHLRSSGTSSELKVRPIPTHQTFSQSPSHQNFPQNHSHENFFQSPESLWSTESWIRGKTWTRAWASPRRVCLIGSHVLSLTEMLRLGCQMFLHHIFEERTFFRYGGQEGMKERPSQTTQTWGYTQGR